MRRRSRLKQTQAKKSQQTVILSIVGIIIILFLLYKFGLTALINFSLFVTGHSGSTQSNQSDSNIKYLPPPILNSMPSATNSAKIIISGTSTKGSSVIVFINNSNVDQKDVDEKGSFNFNEVLSSGNNIITTKAKYKNLVSDYSNQYSVLYANKPPKLDISNPTDGQSFNKNQVDTDNTIQVKGSTDPGATVTINGFFAIIDENNNFSYTLKLNNGDNEIKIIATDSAGNNSEKDLKVNFSP